MSLKNSLAKALVYAVLVFGAMGGVHMRPDEIEKLMNVMHRTKIVHVIRKDDPPEPG